MSHMLVRTRRTWVSLGFVLAEMEIMSNAQAPTVTLPNPQGFISLAEAATALADRITPQSFKKAGPAVRDPESSLTAGQRSLVRVLYRDTGQLLTSTAATLQALLAEDPQARPGNTPELPAEWDAETFATRVQAADAQLRSLGEGARAQLDAHGKQKLESAQRQVAGALQHLGEIENARATTIDPSQGPTRAAHWVPVQPPSRVTRRPRP